MQDFNNIVETEESLQTIDKPVAQDPIKGPAAPAKVVKPKLRNVVEDVLPGMQKGLYSDSQRHNIDISQYEDETNKGRVSLGWAGEDALKDDRANRQGWGEQVGHALGQAVVGEVIGGTIEGLGYIGEVGSVIDYLNGNEADWGNWLTDLGKSTKEYAQDNMAIYQTNASLDPNATMSERMSDFGWWASNGVSVASSLSMMLPSFAATKALGMLGKIVSKGLGAIHKSLDIANKIQKSTSAAWMVEGISQAVVSRHIENSMEASGVFEEKKKELISKINPKTGQLFTEEEATQIASHGAASAYRNNWAMLAQDIPQYLALGRVFNPKLMKYESKIAETAAKGFKPKVLSALGTFASEGGEEAYQYYMSERGKLLSDLKAGLIDENEYETKLNGKVGDNEMITSAFWGGLGGNLFQAVGGAADLFKSKERKQQEESYAIIQKDAIAKRGKALQAMSLEIAKADQSGDPAKRKMAINQSGAMMAIEAVDNDQFAQYIEGLNNMTKMTEEERNALQQEHDIELDPELFKEYVPDLVKQAHEIRKLYLKELNNRHDPVIASKAASNNYQINNLNESLKTITKDIEQLRDVPNANKLSETFKKRFGLKGNIVALKQANAVHEQAIASTSNKVQLQNRRNIIEKNNKKIEKLAFELENETKNDPRTKDEKDSDKLIGAAFEQNADELIRKATEHSLLTDAITLMQKENEHIKSEGYKRELRAKKTMGKAAALTSIEDAEQAKINVEEDSRLSKDEKKETLDILEKRIEVLKEEKKLADAKAKKDQIEKEIKDAAAKHAKNNPVAVPDTNMTPVNGILEDELSSEEADIHKEIFDKEATEKKKKAISSKSISIFGRTGNNNFQDWMLNSKSKVGTPITVVAGEKAYSGSQHEAEQKKAIQDFNNGIVNENVYNHLPLKIIANIEGNTSPESEVSAFLSARLENKGPAYEAAWSKDKMIRIAFIDEMHKNENKTTQSVATMQYGGQVNQAPMYDGVIPENNIADFQHLKLAIDDRFGLNGAEPTIEQTIEVLDQDLMYTNEFGELMNLNGEPHKDFPNSQMMLPLVAGGSKAKVPMRGTIFLSVPKADGFKFPLKLNTQKHSQEEAEIVAGLLVSVINKENKYDTPLSQIKGKAIERIDKALLDSIVKQKELKDKMLSGTEAQRKAFESMKTKFDSMQSSDPSLMEIVNFFTYVSELTQGKNSELYIKGEWVKFGGGDLQVTPKSLFNEKKLVEFLMNTKRKQFSVALWNESPGYREYAISSGLINTDAVVDGPLFGGKTDIYIKAPDSTPDLGEIAKLAEPVTSKGTPDIADRLAMTKKSGVKFDQDKGVHYGLYQNNAGKVVKVERLNESDVLPAIYEMYNKESKSSKQSATTTPVKATANKGGIDPNDISGDEINEINEGYKGGKIDLLNSSGKTIQVEILDEGTKYVAYENGKERILDNSKPSDERLINKALLKSGVLDFKKIVFNRQTYAYTLMPSGKGFNLIINITKGGKSNGASIQSKDVADKIKSLYDGVLDGNKNDEGVSEVSESKEDSKEMESSTTQTQIGSNVNINTKTGGTGVIEEDRANSWLVRKPDGTAVSVLKSNVELFDNIKESNIDDIIYDSEKIVNDILSRGVKEKNSKPITIEDRKNKVDFDLLFREIGGAIKNASSNNTKDSLAMMKSILKEIHPDKFTDNNIKSIANIFAKAIIIEGKKGDIVKLNELHSEFKKQFEILNNSKLQKEAIKAEQERIEANEKAKEIEQSQDPKFLLMNKGRIDVNDLNEDVKLNESKTSKESEPMDPRNLLMMSKSNIQSTEDDVKDLSDENNSITLSNRNEIIEEMNDSVALKDVNNSTSAFGEYSDEIDFNEVDNSDFGKDLDLSSQGNISIDLSQLTNTNQSLHDLDMFGDDLSCKS